MKHVLIVTEANETVASGHLMECIEIANVLSDSGYRVSFMVNDDMPLDFRLRIPVPYIAYRHDLEKGKQDIRGMASRNSVDLVIFNFRSIEDSLLQYIRKDFHGTILCIDELGHRHLSCDVIVNPMIDSYYHEYVDSEAKLYAGAEYLVLPRALLDYHNREKKISPQIQQICVSMGGVDSFGTTLKLAEWLPQMLQGVKIDLVLGGGFQYSSELGKIIAHHEDIAVYRNIDYIYELFFRADLAFCAGGNTLHELACIGTPTIVIPSMPHEVRNGKAFERRGFGICLPITHEVSVDDVQKGVVQFLMSTARDACMKNGKVTVMGYGASNIKRIVDSF